MKTKFCCPECGHVDTGDRFAGEADARVYCALVGELPPAIARLMFEYMRLFSPSKRALSWSRALKLGREIRNVYARGTVERNGRTWAAPAPVIEEALKATIAAKPRLDLPLKDNAYLWSIIQGKANSAEAKAESDRERQRRQRSDRARPATTGGPNLPPESQRALPPGGSLTAALKKMREASESPTTNSTTED